MAGKLDELLKAGEAGEVMEGYNYGFLDENSKREIRRKILKAVSIPGYQVPFGSREMPMAKGWGTGGLEITLSIVGPGDTVKVIDQGCDESMNSSNIRRLVEQTTRVDTTVDTLEASIIQTRHRIPEEKLTEDQILVLQVPQPEPLRRVEPCEARTRSMHAEGDYNKMWLFLYENIVRFGDIMLGADYPVMVNKRYLMSPSPIPRWDVQKLNMGNCLYLFGAGREKRIYAVPPHTRVEPLEFEDYRFRIEDFGDRACSLCGSTDTYLDEVFDEQSGEKVYLCSDTSYCAKKCGGRGEQ